MSPEETYHKVQLIKRKYPDKVPIWIEKAANCDLPNIPKNKYLIPNDLTFSQLLFVVRKHIKISPSTAIFFNINGKMPRMSDTVQSYYSNYQRQDGLLYIHYVSENAFG